MATRFPTPGTPATSKPLRVLLTGATGFVGAQVARVLVDAGCDVHAAVRPGTSRERLAGITEHLTILECDLAALGNPQALAAIGPDICIHLAWYAEPGRYLQAVPENLRSLRETLGLIEAAAAAGCRRFVSAGTCAEYGVQEPGPPVRETSSINPSTPYARAKAALWLTGQDVAGSSGMEWVWARIFFLFGPWEHPGRVVPSAILACLRGDAFPATPGEQCRDYLHVRDVASAIWSVAASELQGAVNVSSGQTVALRSVLEEIEVATGQAGLVRFGERNYLPGEWMWMCGDNSLLRGTGWRPLFDLGTGIADTVEWWRRRPDQAT